VACELHLLLTHSLTYLHSYLPTYLPTYLSIFHEFLWCVCVRHHLSCVCARVYVCVCVCVCVYAVLHTSFLPWAWPGSTRRAVLPCCRPADLLSATSREVVGKLLFPPRSSQHGAGCGVQVVKEWEGAGFAGAECDGAARTVDAVSVAPPWCAVRWWVRLVAQVERVYGVHRASDFS